jgi:hypothetical protein
MSTQPTVSAASDLPQLTSATRRRAAAAITEAARATRAGRDALPRRPDSPAPCSTNGNGTSTRHRNGLPPCGRGRLLARSRWPIAGPIEPAATGRAALMPSAERRR